MVDEPYRSGKGGGTTFPTRVRARSVARPPFTAAVCIESTCSFAMARPVESLSMASQSVTSHYDREVELGSRFLGLLRIVDAFGQLRDDVIVVVLEHSESWLFGADLAKESTEDREGVIG